MANQSQGGKGLSGPSGGQAEYDAAGLGPVLDLLGEMENQVGHIAHNRPAETTASLAADEELSRLREELLAADRRGYEQLASFTLALEDLKQAIPALLDETVNSRFLEIEDSFHRNIKEIHSRSIDSFTQTVHSKIGQRIAAMEIGLSVHTEAMGQLREHYLKTDRNVQRLMAGLDRLTAELMRLSGGNSPNLPRTIYTTSPTRVERAERVEKAVEKPERYDFRPPAQSAPLPEEAPTASAADLNDAPPPQRVRRKKAQRRSAILVSIIALLFLVPLGFIAWQIRSTGGVSARAKEGGAAEKPLTGIPAQMRMAADFASDKDYAKAESTYRLILKSEPNNRVAIKELASVLFRQQRYEDAATALKSLPPE
jgi:tetratricopeptide (TPR) repeat protein